MISILFALLAGIATIAAPCTLPILPILLGTSLADRGGSRRVFVAIGFIFSFSVVTFLFSFVSRILGIEPDHLRTLAIVLLAIFGVLLLEVAANFDERLPSIPIGAVIGRNQQAGEWSNQGPAGALLLGTSLGLVWTPCAGPVLGSILTLLLVTQTDLEWRLSYWFSTPSAPPFPYWRSVTADGMWRSVCVGIAPHTQRIQQGFGVLVVGFAIAMYFQYDTLVSAWLLNFYPGGQIGLLEERTSP